MTLQQIIASRLQLRESQIAQTIRLLDEGATIPFIARYRKEATGNLDEVQVAAIASEHTKLQELAHRKQYVLETIEAQEKLTPELRQRIEQSWEATEIEDIYLPFKPKRRTRAQMAREKGLEGLAQSLLLTPIANPERTAEKYLSDQVPSVEEALQGARDILAEQISEDERTRNTLRTSRSLCRQSTAVAHLLRHLATFARPTPRGLFPNVVYDCACRLCALQRRGSTVGASAR